MRPAIKVEHLSKQYRLGRVGTGTLSHDLNRAWHRVRGKDDPYTVIGDESVGVPPGTIEYVWALKDVGFEVEQGKAIGIIGRNGAGKSTLLKLLSRTTGPTLGRIRIKGRVASLLEVGTGFHPDLTGRENVFLNGVILGMTAREVRRKFDEIVDFSGIGRYIDTPVKRYSTGMQVRLGFAVAAHLDPEILIVDEVLAVGDAEFQNKCLGKMKNVTTGEGRTVLFVSHNLGAVKKLCDSGILLVDGKLRATGPIDTVVQDYLELSEERANTFVREVQWGPNQPIWFEQIAVGDKDGSAKRQFLHDEAIYVDYQFGFTVDPESHDYTVFVTVLDHLKNRIFSAESEVVRSTELRLRIDPGFLVRGRYSIHTFLHKAQTERIDVAEDVCSFSVIDNGSELNVLGDYDYGRVFGRVEWT